MLGGGGANDSGQTTVPSGLGTVTQVSAPAGLGTVSQIAAGGGHACAITSAGAVRCWGAHSFGQAQIPAYDPSIDGLKIFLPLTRRS